MIQASRARRRTHFDPESTIANIVLQKQKDELLVVLTDYIAKTRTKDETLAGLSSIQAVCEICDQANLK
jgi:hypothetical protein